MFCFSVDAARVAASIFVFVLPDAAPKDAVQTSGVKNAFGACKNPVLCYNLQMPFLRIGTGP